MRPKGTLHRSLLLAVMTATTLASSVVSVAQAQGGEFVVQIDDSSQKDTAWIGVWLQDVVDGGIQIVALVPGGPAELASLRVGDIILMGNARPLIEQAALNRLLEDLTPGDPLELRVVRGSSTIDTKLTVASRSARYGVTSRVAERRSAPRTVPIPPTSPRPASELRELTSLLFSNRRGSAIGVQVTDVTPALRSHYGAPAEFGVLVTRSESGGVASRSGISVGDVIVRVGGVEISSARELEGALLRWNTKTVLPTELVRGGKPKIIQLDATLESHAEEAQDGVARRDAERELMSRRLQLELQRLERRMSELRKELEKLERDKSPRGR